MTRYAVLHDVTSEEGGPVGLAIEMDGHVLVHVPADYGMPSRHDGEYRVLEPDMTYVVYAPGDAGYFDQVLVDLSWTFGVGEQGVVAGASYANVLELYVRKIDQPQERLRVGEYDMALTHARERTPDAKARAVRGDRSAYVHEPRDAEVLPAAARGTFVAA